MIDPHAGTIRVLRRTQPWVRLASVVGLLLAALLAFLGIDGAVGGLRSQRFDGVPFLLLEFLFSFGFLVPSIYLLKFASRISAFVAQGHTVDLDSALESLRKFWKFTGLFVLLSVFLLMMAAGFALV